MNCGEDENQRGEIDGVRTEGERERVGHEVDNVGGITTNNRRGSGREGDRIGGATCCCMGRCRRGSGCRRSTVVTLLCRLCLCRSSIIWMVLHDLDGVFAAVDTVDK